MTHAVHTPAGPTAYDIVEIVDQREAPRLHAVVESVSEPHLLLRLERAVVIPARAPVRWFDGDTAWQAASHIEHIDATSVNCQLAPPPEWEPAPVRKSLRTAVNNSPILVKVVDDSRLARGRPWHAVCLDISASGCRATWPGPAPQIGDRVEIAWEVSESYADEEPQWVSARVARIVEMPFGTRQIGFAFELADPSQTARVREWHQGWLREHRRRLTAKRSLALGALARRPRAAARLRELHLPARDAVRGAGGPSDRDDRRPVRGCAGGAEQGRIADEDDRPGWGVDLFAVDGEDRVPGHHHEELLVAVRLVRVVVGLVMRLDHLVAGVSGDGVDAECLYVEMAADEMERAGVDVGVPGVDLRQGVDVGQADGAIRCGARIAHAADTATAVPALLG